MHGRFWMKQVMANLVSSCKTHNVRAECSGHGNLVSLAINTACHFIAILTGTEFSQRFAQRVADAKMSRRKFRIQHFKITWRTIRPEFRAAIPNFNLELTGQILNFGFIHLLTRLTLLKPHIPRPHGAGLAHHLRLRQMRRPGAGADTAGAHGPCPAAR